MAKKRKLNSKNPKWGNISKREDRYNKEFVREVKGVKIYKLHLK
jgi:methylphosphotriester-DNA--protein-cysteine methyltransferase